MNYFKDLNINVKSSLDEIEKAFNKLALKHHPNKGGNSQTFVDIKH